MATVDFSTQPWADRETEEKVACDEGGEGNTFQDPAGVTFLIAEGLMKPITTFGSRWLYYTYKDCDGTEHSPHPATLVIRFDSPQQRVVMGMAEDPDIPPKMIWYYREHDRTGELEVRSLPLDNHLHTVHYDSPCMPVKEVVIRSAAPENNIKFVEFGPSQVFTYVRFVLCLVERVGVFIRSFWPRHPPRFNWEKKE